MSTKLTLLIAIALPACTTYKPAEKSAVDTTKTVTVGYDVAWKRIIEFTSSHGMNIKTIDKASGVIVFDRAKDAAFSTQFLDCGNVSQESANAGSFSPISLNITTIKESETKTKVAVNLFGSVTFYYGYNVFKDYPCYTKGEFERQVFCAAEGTVCEVAKPLISPSPTPKSAVLY